MAALGNANITLNDKSYPALADGKYDVVICGTGLTECIVSELLCQENMPVLQVDRNQFYGSACASLTLTNLFKNLKEEPTKDEVELLGKDRYYNVDLIPKLNHGVEGSLVKIILYTKTEHYLSFGKGGQFVCCSRKKPAKVPSNATEAVKTPLVGFFKKGV